MELFVSWERFAAERLSAAATSEFPPRALPATETDLRPSNNEPDKISHPATASPDSRSTASQIEFAIGTGGFPSLHSQTTRRARSNSGRACAEYYQLCHLNRACTEQA